jgi:glucose-1-phosphate adenylyltransferase
MGGSIMPMLSDAGDAYVYDFSTNLVPGATERDHGYWRDVGTIDSYFDAHMDLVSVTPVFNLYNDRWPIYTLPPQLPPAKFVLGGRAEESMVSAGAIIGGGSVHNSVVSPGVHVDRGARVEDSVLMDGVVVGEGAYVRRAILDKNVVVPPWARIGVDTVADAERYHVSTGGVTVLGKGARAVV